MSKFYPEKLSVKYRDDVTATEPIIPRRYTLTHSDLTGELFLIIGLDYAWDQVNPLRDEVLGEWKKHKSLFYFCVYLYVDQGQYSMSVSAKRYEIFRRELPLALTAMRYGDRFLFNTYPHLDQAFIIINFISAYPTFARRENWGTFQSMTT
ncbi:staygreen family protein [Lederbergia citrea]|uniref:Staygreen family protein n=1 Tax=Lederbergia citrea TaxID=2833581 RepID=A0A942Z5V4_9BACI|nr:staygreen family protein [Lederbergia citrea]